MPARRRAHARSRRRRAAPLRAALAAVICLLAVAGGTAAASLLPGSPNPGHAHAGTRSLTGSSRPAPKRGAGAGKVVGGRRQPRPPAAVWRVAWGSAMAWGYGVADDATVRDLVTVGAAGQAVRFRVSNVFGDRPLVVGMATVAATGAGAAVVPGTIHQITFAGAAGTTLPVGQVGYTDPVQLDVSAGQQLSVSLWVEQPDLVSLHPCCTATASYVAPNGTGNLTADPSLATSAVASPFERFVDAADVLQTAGRGSIVVVGDSITDGFNTSLKWTQVLRRRIATLPAPDRRPVVNEGITANALTSAVHTDALTGGGPAGVSRLARDALSQPGVGEVVLFLGTNDLWFGATARDVIAGYQDAIAQAHASHVRIIGVTLLPRATSPEEYWSPLDQQRLTEIDTWIRSSGAFDAVIDAAPALADRYDGQCSPTQMFGPFDSGDHLHPGPAGQIALADAVDPAVLDLPPLPPAPPLVAATPTPGCGT
jgi:lysophospholipase L1-like esterase